MAFYLEIDNYKKTYKLNNTILGDVVGLNADAFRMAVNRKSLSELQIRELEKYFSTLSTSERNPNKTEQLNPVVDSIAKELLKSKVFIEGIKAIFEVVELPENKNDLEELKADWKEFLKDVQSKKKAI